MSADALARFHPTDDVLMRLAFQAVDESMLREIAAADYGQDADAHLVQLQAIKRGAVPAPMSWEPKEVLELIRWSQPEDPTWSPGSQGQRGHWMRLFSCAVLLRAAAEPGNDGYFWGEDSTVIQLVESAIRLDKNTARASLRFLCWRIQHWGQDTCERPYCTIAILLLAIFLNNFDSDSISYLIAIANSGDCLLSELFEQSQKKETWIRLTSDILIKSEHTIPEVKDWARNLICNSE